MNLDHQPSSNEGRKAIKGGADTKGTGTVIITLLVLIRLVGITLATVIDIAEDTTGGLSVLLDGDLARVPVDGDLSAVADAARQHTGVASTLVLEGLRAARAAVHAGVVDDQRAVVHVFVGGRAGVLDVHVGARDGLREGEDGAELEELHFVLFIWSVVVDRKVFFVGEVKKFDSRRRGWIGRDGWNARTRGTGIGRLWHWLAGWLAG